MAEQVKRAEIVACLSCGLLRLSKTTEIGAGLGADGASVTFPSHCPCCASSRSQKVDVLHGSFGIQTFSLRS